MRVASDITVEEATGVAAVKYFKKIMYLSLFKLFLELTRSRYQNMNGMRIVRLEAFDEK